MKFLLLIQKLRQKAENSTQRRAKARFLFFVAGIASTLWFLIRVIPKPSRAVYPCMRVAAPIMSGFIIYLVTLTGSVMGLRKAREKFAKARYLPAFGFFLLALVSILAFGLKNSRVLEANTHNLFDISTETADAPIGVPQGYYPGRVVWVMDKDATNENCTNTSGDFWFEDKNTDQAVVSKMLSDGIRKMADTTSSAKAWDCLFKYFNLHHNKGAVGYTSGEKIVIKINMTNMGSGGHLNSEMDNTPQLMLALLEQLVDTVGVPQEDITIGDPYRGFAMENFNLCHDKYPNIHYIESSGGGGRTQTALTSNNVFFTSDDNFASRLPQAYMDADYMINMPCLKSHNSAGMTLAAKNHQGSVIGPDQTPTSQLMLDYLHYDYPDVTGDATGIYRHLVDYMAHSRLGGNTLVYLVDAIWSGRNWNGIVDKFGMSPFNGDYTSSIFLSQDAVAIESVGYDFLYSEYSGYRDTYHGGDDFPMWTGVNDYIKQAADPANWPSGIKYDPDHTDHSHPVGSLGVYEHWNNANDKQYSVNLTGNKGGIDLVSVPANLVSSVPLNYTHEVLSAISGPKTNDLGIRISPNPVSGIMQISYNLDRRAHVKVDLYDLSGQLILNLLNTDESAGNNSHTIDLTSENIHQGLYICRVTAAADGRQSVNSGKVSVQD